MPSPWHISSPTRTANCWASPRSPARRKSAPPGQRFVQSGRQGHSHLSRRGPSHAGEQRQPIAQQAAALPRWPHETDFPKDQAVDFLADTIRSHPGEVTLLTIGPLTNAGMLFSAHPDVAELLAGLVMMGGNFDEAGPEAGRIEWNVAGDPFASEITYKTPVRLHRSLGLNVTQKVMMSADEVRQRFTALPCCVRCWIWQRFGLQGSTHSSPSMILWQQRQSSSLICAHINRARSGWIIQTSPGGRSGSRAGLMLRTKSR